VALAFVLLWSTGFIAAKLGLPYAGPFTFLALRFAIVALILVAVALATRAPWPRSAADIGHLAATGALVHACYLGGVFYAIGQGVPAGVSALIVGLQPLLVGVLAHRLLGERLGAVEWLGLLLGFGGVVLVVWEKVGSGVGTPAGVAANVVALAGMTAGTLYQRRHGGKADLRTGNAVQFAAGFAVTLALAAAFETGRVVWTPAFALALGWSVVVLSLGAITLLYLLIRRGGAARASSLIYMTPPCTALMAWAAFGETLSPPALVGMALTVAGVAMVHRRG
jgi:drug/metabolite transporter (DMT)-like permease